MPRLDGSSCCFLFYLAASGCSGAIDAAADGGPGSVDSGVRADAAGPTDAHAADGAVGSEFLPRYTTDLSYSPLTRAIAHRLSSIAAVKQSALHGDVFMKAGDSIAVATEFMSCFGGSSVKLGQNTDLAP